MTYTTEIVALANFIMAEVPGEPSQSEGAGHAAIRIIRTQQARIEELEKDARRYRLLRGPNDVATSPHAYGPEEAGVWGGKELDDWCDEHLPPLKEVKE